MLVLTRNIMESIFIGKHFEIEIKILGIIGQQVRVGINASRDIPVWREELVEIIKKERGLG